METEAETGERPSGPGGAGPPEGRWGQGGGVRYRGLGRCAAFCVFCFFGFVFASLRFRGNFVARKWCAQDSKQAPLGKPVKSGALQEMNTFAVATEEKLKKNGAALTASATTAEDVNTIELNIDFTLHSRMYTSCCTLLSVVLQCCPVFRLKGAIRATGSDDALKRARTHHDVEFMALIASRWHAMVARPWYPQPTRFARTCFQPRRHQSISGYAPRIRRSRHTPRFVRSARLRCCFLPQ